MPTCSRSMKSDFVQGILKRLTCSATCIAATAFLFRIGILWLHWHRIIGTAEANGPYGFEVGQIAKSIVLGKGFSSPLLMVETGPTAHLCPIYTYLVAGVFKLWGIYTVKSHIFLQAINCGFAALTVFPIFAIAKRTFGESVAVGASWLWVVLPNAWHIPMNVWDSTLFALFFALIFLATIEIQESKKALIWVLYGLLWAMSSLINATILSVFLPLLGWLHWNRRNRASSRHVAIALLSFAVGIAPWMIRNYRVLGTFTPLRSSFGLMLWVGNNPVVIGTDSFRLTPFFDQQESIEYRRVGEIAYMHAKEHEALVFMRSHIAGTMVNILRRFGLNWFEVTDRGSHIWSADPLYLKGLFALNALIILLSWLGAGFALRSHTPAALAYLLVILFYPLVYYLTSPLVRYRFAIDPILVILAVYGLRAVVLKNVSPRTATLDAVPNV